MTLLWWSGVDLYMAFYKLQFGGGKGRKRMIMMEKNQHKNTVRKGGCLDLASCHSTFKRAFHSSFGFGPIETAAISGLAFVRFERPLSRFPRCLVCSEIIRGIHCVCTISIPMLVTLFLFLGQRRETSWFYHLVDLIDWNPRGYYKTYTIVHEKRSIKGPLASPGEWSLYKLEFIRHQGSQDHEKKSSPLPEPGHSHQKSLQYSDLDVANTLHLFSIPPGHVLAPSP